MPKKESGEGAAEKKEPKKHLHQIITEHITDKDGKTQGYVHHHVFKDKHSDAHSHPPRPMGMSQTPEEAGEHVTEQMQQAASPAGGGGQAPEAEEPPEGGAAPAPAEAEE
jgi:hypothetical protein